MGSSRTKPLSTKEVEKFTAERPSTIRHHALGGVPGFVIVHTPGGHTGYGLFYRHQGKLRKLTLGSTKMLKLGEARKLAMEHRGAIEAGRDPHGEKASARLAPAGLDCEQMWDKYVKLAASQLRSRPEKDRVFQRYLRPVLGRLPVIEVKRSHALEVIDPLVAVGSRPSGSGVALTVR